MRHHHIGREEKLRLQRIVARKLGIKISGLAGLYCYFLLLADAWLADGGLGVWLIPSEFMDVNYGQAVKRYLTEHVKLLHIHRFCPADVQFSDALVSSAVVVFEKSLPPPRHTVRFTHGGTLLDPQAEQAIPLATLRRTRKWTNYPEASPAVHVSNGDALTLADLFTIKRGLATGANDFFIRPREEVESWSIPAEFVKPILPSPRHLAVEIIEADPDGFPRLPKVLCLIDCDRPEHELQKCYPLFWNYLQTGKKHGIHEGYLASRRVPWYAQEKRAPAPFLCTYMGRTSNGRRLLSRLGRMPYNYRMRRLLKRWYFWLTVLVVIPALFIVIGLIYSGQGPINQANFDRIQEGMTEEQVAAILGPPTNRPNFTNSLIWVNGPDVIAVNLGDTGRVIGKAYNPPTAWRRLRWHVNNWLARRGLSLQR